MDKTFEALKKEIVKRNLVQRIVSFLCGVFLLALNYNLLVVPNNFNIGGTSGLAIIFKELFGLKPSIFILGSSVILGSMLLFYVIIKLLAPHFDEENEV